MSAAYPGPTSRAGSTGMGKEGQGKIHGKSWASGPNLVQSFPSEGAGDSVALTLVSIFENMALLHN